MSQATFEVVFISQDFCWEFPFFSHRLNDLSYLFKAGSLGDQWLAPLPHSKKVLGSNLVPTCGFCVLSLRFLWDVAPAPEKHARLMLRRPDKETLTTEILKLRTFTSWVKIKEDNNRKIKLII